MPSLKISQSTEDDLFFRSKNSMNINNCVNLEIAENRMKVLSTPEKQDIRVFYYEATCDRSVRAGIDTRYQISIDDSDLFARIGDLEFETVSVDARAMRRKLVGGNEQAPTHVLPKGEFDIIFVKIKTMMSGSTRLVFYDQLTRQVAFSVKIEVERDEKMRRNTPSIKLDATKHEYPAGPTANKPRYEI